ncbi:hypothetical protein FH972_026137 [Carpinus fangiana]|uniref:Uncharacterized protein n=1 Tax=Carpinus fangiana TaxID=176857 RepID=A0A5N6L395_9ROSI|nr:hypothetical protein FH972_026137 [Carpinus fangiana]
MLGAGLSADLVDIYNHNLSSARLDHLRTRQHSLTTMNTSTMDVDMDIDLGGGPDEEVLEAESMAIEEAQANMTNANVGTAQTDLAPEKVNVRGLDHLTTDDIKAFAAEHFPSEDITRVEWVDDTSANIVYPSAEIAGRAILHFAQDASLSTDVLASQPLELRQAKLLSTHLDTPLQVRVALMTDVKAPRAREASRFYLLNPDKDPENRRNRDSNNRKGPRGPKRRRDEEEEVPFDVNMYDDDAGSLAARLDRPLTTSRLVRRKSDDILDRDHRSRSKRVRTGTVSGVGGDLFSDRLLGARRNSRPGSARLRDDRSASPLRAAGGDGRYGFSEDASGVREQGLSPNAYPSRELFPAGPAGRSGSAQGKELFPNHSTPQRADRELFPDGRGANGTPSSIHRRTDAFDANDETPEHVARSPLIKGRSLADRITRGGAGTPLEDRISKGGGGLESRITGGPETTADGGMSIRGSAQTDNSSPGLSIKGNAGKLNPRVRELFPEKADNSGKELFARVAPRRKAGDLFG